MVFDVNSTAVRAHTETLRRISKNALPYAVQQTLSKAAFDVKKTTMPNEAKGFTQRSPTFFKSTSTVKPAKWGTIDSMEAIVGFRPKTGNRKEAGGATEDLEQQEHSGKIGHRSFIPLKTARAGNNWNRNVRAALRMGRVRSKIINAKNSRARTEKAKFLRSAAHAGAGGFVIGNKTSSGGNKLLWVITKVWREKGHTRFKGMPIYSVRNNRSVHVKATHFMQKASVKSADKMNMFFIEAAEKRINRIK